MMRMEVTERDKTLLIFLSVLLLAAAYLFLGILPLHRANQEMKAQLVSAEADVAEKERKVLGLAEVISANDELKRALAHAQDSLYPMMESREIDRILTGLALEHGLSIRRMEIQMPSASSDLEAFGSGRGQAERAGTGSVKTESAGTGSAKAGSVKAGSVKTESARTGSAEVGSVRTGNSKAESTRTGSVKTESADGAKGGTTDGVYHAYVLLEVSGSRADEDGLLDEIAQETPGIRAVSMRRIAGKSRGAAEEKALEEIMELELEISMCRMIAEE